MNERQELVDSSSSARRQWRGHRYFRARGALFVVLQIVMDDRSATSRSGYDW